MVIFLLAANFCAGQKRIIFRGETPVEKEFSGGVLKQLQLNFDYSITLSFSSSWDTGPNYYILAKKGDSLTAWRYNKPAPSRSRRNIQTDTSLHQVEVERVKLESLLDIILKNAVGFVEDVNVIGGLKINSSNLLDDINEDDMAH